MDKYVMLAQLQTAFTAFAQKLRKWVEQQGFMKNPATDGEEGQVLSTDGRGKKFWKTVETAGAAREALSAAKKYTDKKLEDVGAGVDREAVAEIVQEKIDEAKENGEFDYELTDEEKNEIAKEAAGMIEIPEVDLDDYAKKTEIPKKVSELENDSEYLTAIPDDYAKKEDIPKKPNDIGAQPAGNYALKSEIPAIPVQSVNGKTGEVSLSATDVNARPDNWMPTAQEVGALPSTYMPPNQTAEQVGADPKGAAASAVGSHNTNTAAHNDIRLELKAINDRLTAFFDSDNQTLDELSEIVAYITNNKSLIDSITTSKVSVADIINNLTTNVANKPLSAAQGVALKALIDAVDSGKLDASKLPTAINTALAQAKESGEFDGKTPVRGTDYWTEADQEAIVQQVIAALGTPVFGTIDADNNITLTGKLAEGKYVVKYEDAEGNTTVVGTIDTSPGYTNMLLKAVEADDTPYNGGQGWKANTRLSSSGGESTSSATGMEVTGFIPFKRGDVIRFEDIVMNKNSEHKNGSYFIQYDSNKTMLAQWVVSAFNGAIDKGWVLVDDNYNILQINTGDFDLSDQYTIKENAAYFRISAEEINADSIITINQEIN